MRRLSALVGFVAALGIVVSLMAAPMHPMQPMTTPMQPMTAPSGPAKSAAPAAPVPARSVPATAAHDWPQWQGPNRDAISAETGLLAEWPNDGPPLLWKGTGLGKGLASVAIVGNRAYTMGDRDGQAAVVAMDLATHKVVWTASVGPEWPDNGEHCTPTVDGGLVYALSCKSDLVCVDAKTGREQWRKNLMRDFGGQMMSVWGYSESPLVDGEKLICTPGAKAAMIVALDKKTGRLIWRSAVPSFGQRGKDGAGYASCVVSEGGGIRQYVTLVGRGLIGVAAKDGKFLWGYDRVANGTANIPTPVVRGDYVFGSAGYGAGAALLKLTASGDSVKAQEVYFLDGNTFQNHHGGFVLVGDYIYGGHGHTAGAPVCIEFLTGKVMWRVGQPAGGSAAVAYADGRLYFRYESGSMVLIEATPEGYRQKGMFTIPVKTAESWPHPSIADGRLYLRDNDTLMCFDIKKK